MVLLSELPTRIILLLIETAAWDHLFCLKRDWEESKWLVLTSMLRSESIPLVPCAKICKMSWCRTLRRRPVGDRFPRQRGCGNISLGRRIKGWEGWEDTFARKGRDGAVGYSWESFDACFSFTKPSTSGYDESCKRKAVENTNNNTTFSLN